MTPSHTDTYTAHQLDEALESGHFRIGARLITQRYMVYEGVLRSVVWTRLPLDGYVPSASQRKKLRRIQRAFDLKIGPYMPSEAHQRVYEIYRQHARGWRPDQLEAFLHGETPADPPFDTHHVSFWQDGELKGFSLFDVGTRTAQSLIGAYTPEVSKFGLGFASMIFEAQWAQSQGMTHHYAGYVLPGEQAMSYKLQLGQLEAYDADKRYWLPYSELPGRQHSVPRLMRALKTVAIPLDVYTSVERVIYGPFPLPMRDPKMHDCLGEPIFLRCKTDTEPFSWVVLFDSESRVYRVLWCEQFEHEISVLEGDKRVMTPIKLWRRIEEHLVTPSARRVVRWLGRALTPELPQPSEHGAVHATNE